MNMERKILEAFTPQWVGDRREEFAIPLVGQSILLS